MTYFLSKDAVLKWLETKAVYHIGRDELYELDDEAFRFLRKCASMRGCSSPDERLVMFCLREGLISREKVHSSRPPIRRSPRPSLRYLELQITDRCNLRCKHCYIDSDSRNNELSPSQVRAVLTEFERMQGIRVLITGGEPLLHSRFLEINSILPQFSVRKVLFTNGLLLNQEILELLNVEELQVSIDGLRGSHDLLRGKGTFRRSMEAVHSAMAYGLDVSISTMIHPANLNDFRQMEELFRDMGIKSWTVDVPCTTGRLKEYPEFRLSAEAAGKYLIFGYGNTMHSPVQGFGCGVHLAAVTAGSGVSKCSFFADRPVGRIEEGLRRCWTRIRPVELAKLSCDCKWIDTCRGGCRYRAEIMGSPSGKDLYRCAYFAILNQKMDRRGKSSSFGKGEVDEDTESIKENLDDLQM